MPTGAQVHCSAPVFYPTHAHTHCTHTYTHTSHAREHAHCRYGSAFGVQAAKDQALATFTAIDGLLHDDAHGG